MSYIMSWSGGKDSCFAYYKAIQEGYEISHLINIISKENKRVSSHWTQSKLIQLQAELIGLPLIQEEVINNYYERGLKRAIKSLINSNIKGMIFGDMYVEEYIVQKHKIWAEKVCKELGIEAIEPLWGIDPEKTFLKIIDLGFEALIVSAKVGLIGKEWIGQKVNKAFLEYLKRNKIDLFGEKGEYHTFITDCPMFEGKIIIKKSKVITRDGYWFLDIIDY